MLSLMLFTGAMHRTPDGIVTNVGERPCVGCWMCVMVCPYVLIRAEEQRRQALKCGRVCLQKADLPACVAACPTRALVYEPVDEFSREKRQAYTVEAILPALNKQG